MPDHPDKDAIAGAGDAAKSLDLSTGVTKYIPDTRSAIEERGTDGAKRGGWAKLNDKGSIGELAKSGAYLDLIIHEVAAIGFDLAVKAAVHGVVFK